MFLRGHYDDSLMDLPKKMVLKSKTSPSLLSFLFLLSVSLGCDKSHREVSTRSRPDRVTQLWTSRLPNCEDPATPIPMGSRLGSEALGPLPSLGIASGRHAVVQSSVPGPPCLRCLHVSPPPGMSFPGFCFSMAIHHSGFKNCWLKDSLCHSPCLICLSA